MIEALLYEKIDNNKTRCLLCNHYCSLSDRQTGICGVRINREGVLYAEAYGNIIVKNIDPVEKKPLYHFLPGTKTYSIAAPGCNFHCDFCQNWQISQINEKRINVSDKSSVFSSEDIVTEALRTSCRSIAFTYTEPTVFYEVIKDVSSHSIGAGIKLVMVSNGYMSRECLEDLNLFIDAYNIDLKSFSGEFYKNNCGAKLQPVLDNITNIAYNNKLLEITTLVIPGENDSPEELDRIASFISKLNKDIPWHVSRFFPNYRLKNHPVTNEQILKSALSSGKKHGLKYVYTGNTSEDNSTYCPGCGFTVACRKGFNVTRLSITERNTCPECDTVICGIWR